MFDNQLTDVQVDMLLTKAAKSTNAVGIAMNKQPSYFYYRTAPLCRYCDQVIADTERETSVRDSDGNDFAVHRECAHAVMLGIWTMLEHEGEGNPGHFEDDSHSHEDLLPDEDSDQIRPYVVAPIDETTPMATLGPVHRDRPQQVHNPR